MRNILKRKKGNNGFRFTIVVLLLLVATFVNRSFANDTLAEITPQGLQLKTEENISIEKEYLYISLKRIEVSYVFKNHSDKDITSEVAFPVPPYWALSVKNDNYSHYPVNFGDFIVEVDGKQIDYKKEVRAVVNGKDNTDILKSLDISIENFGRFDFSKPHAENDISKLSKSDKKRLRDLGILVAENKVVEPNWTVSIKYHWTQKFPANSVVNIKHSYTPYPGSFYVPSLNDLKLLDNYLPDNFVKDGCLDQRTKRAIEKKILRKVNQPDKLIYFQFVSYILTTANNWKKPIKNFHLILEKPEDSIMSLCFDHKLKKINLTRFEANIENFIPSRDLKIYYISGE